MKQLIEGIILRNDFQAVDTYKLSIQLNNAETLQLIPGQFVMLSCPGATPVFLRRPFSVAAFQNNTLEILYRVLGKGTCNLSLMKSGQTIDMVAPCGNGFDLSEHGNILIFAGGLGSAPMSFVANSLLASPKINHLFFYYGTRLQKERIPFPLLENSPAQFFFHADDAPDAHEHLFSFFMHHPPSQKIHQVFCCGSMPLMRTVSAWCLQENLPLQVSLEQRMACGTGACYGCSIPTHKGMQTVCYDGPVFDSRMIDWAEPCLN